MQKDSIYYSIIIPTYLRQNVVKNTLMELEKQSYKNFEIIVIDQTPIIDPILCNYNSINNNYKYIHYNIIGLPNARNYGASQASGDILIFIDDDTIPDKDLIISYSKSFELLGSRVLIGGRVIEKDTNIFKERKNISGGWITWFGKTLKNFDTGLSGYCEWAPGGNFAVSRSLFNEVGGFDTKYNGTAVLEDCDFGYAIRKNKGEVYYDHNPMVEHLRAKEGGVRQENFDKNMFYRSQNTVYFFRKYGMKKNLFFVFIYLNAVAIKDFIKKKHSIYAFIWTWRGFFRGIINNR